MDSCFVKVFDFDGQAVELLDLFQDEPYVFFLDSVSPNRTTGRFSFIGFDPFEIFQSKGPGCWRWLKKNFSRYSSQAPCVSVSPLSGGIVGYLGYDLGFYLENISRRIKKDLSLPDCFLGCYDCVITVDHFQKKLIITSTGYPEKNSLQRRVRARQRLSKILQRLAGYKKKSISVEDRTKFAVSGKLPDNFKSDFTKENYLKAIKKILEHIKRGDVYQVNLSQRFEYPVPSRISSLDIYKRFRRISAFNLGGYMDCGDLQIMSGSPERFIKLEKGLVLTRPMKGTRARGENPSDDKKKRQDLLKSDKDRAELLMITDLERNDLGRVCEYGSIKVKQMRTLEKYKTVFQTTSTVEGKLRKDKNAFDVLQACFPGGSVTGCPKIRAMRIIEDLEPHHRGIYTGALGYMSFSGRHMDFNILIRTLIAMRNKIYFHTGGGIVADSSPDEEYEETLVKAKAMRLCLEKFPGD